MVISCVSYYSLCKAIFQIKLIAWFFLHQFRHQYDAYKQQLMRNNGIPPRERSPRARRFFHRRQPRDFDPSDRNGGMRGRRRRPNEHVSNDNNQEQNIENSTNKKTSQMQRRRYHGKRRNKAKSPTAEQSKDDAKSDSLQLTESNLTTLLSELNMDNKPLNTANSTSSESLDFEKINTEDTALCSASMIASSRLAAAFNKGN